MQDLKAKTIRGGLARLFAQGASFLLRVGSLMVLARLLGPRDFGLVGMVTAFTGVLSWFRDFGLSSAAVQRATVTEEQLSTLFWVNIALGAFLALVAVAMAPAIAAFYNEPQLFGVTTVLAAGFLFNSAGVQHSALLQRQMRFTVLAVISVVSLIIGTAIGIGGARAGYGYWALVAMTVTQPLIATIGFWMATGWIPGMPHRRAGIRSMLHFGGTLSLNGLVAYVAYNADKVMIGRFWGVDAIGIYGRAFQLVTIPTENVNSAVGEVAFSALARLQDDPIRLRNYFLKGFSLVLGLTLPTTIACALFADDIVLFFLGPNWKDAAAIVRLLSSDNGDFGDNQSLRMADLFDRTGSTRLEDCSCLRADHDYGLRYRTALWTQRSRISLLGGDDFVGHSTYFVVCTRYGDFSPGHSADGEPAVGFRHSSWRSRLWSAANLRRIRFPFASTCSRM